MWPAFNLGPTTPSWVQAIGSIVAVGVAIYVPSRIGANDRLAIRAERARRDSYRERTLAIALRLQLRTPVLELINLVERGGGIDAARNHLCLDRGVVEQATDLLLRFADLVCDTARFGQRVVAGFASLRVFIEESRLDSDAQFPGGKQGFDALVQASRGLVPRFEKILDH